MRGLAGQRRHHGDGGGAAADDDYPLAGVVQILRPVLRVNDGAREVLDAGELGRVGIVVVVVAGAEEDEAAAVALGLAFFGDVHGPGVGGGIPIGGTHLSAETDVGIDTVLVGGVIHVVADLVAVGDVLLTGPGFPWPAQGEDRGVRAHARVAEQIPGATDAVTTLEDDVSGRAVALAEMVGGAKSGDTRADDHDVKDVAVGLGGAGAFVRGDGHGTTLGSARAGRPETSVPRPIGPRLACLGRAARD